MFLYCSPNLYNVAYFLFVVVESVDESLTSPYTTLYDWITPLGMAGSSQVILTDDDEVDSNVRLCTGPGALMGQKGHAMCKFINRYGMYLSMQNRLKVSLIRIIIPCIFLPVSTVLIVLHELNGPVPFTVAAATFSSYAVPGPSPVTL